MFIFALGVNLRGKPFHARRALESLDAFPATPTDGTRVAASPRGAAGLGIWSVVRRDLSAAPSWDPEAGLLFVGDVRLYNRPELCTEFGLPTYDDQVSDLELARRAYLRWGLDSPKRLVGDFAFAVWDETQHKLFAARDHLGIRPAFFRVDGDEIVVASDVAQILPFLARPSEEINTERVFDWFSARISDQRRTFFTSISRLRPGHYLCVSQDRGLEEIRYWSPDLSPFDRDVPYERHCNEIAETFERAVRDRIDSDHPIVAHSSGGFDSSSIVVTADQIYRDERWRAPLCLVSGVAPGYPSDETNHIRAVGDAVTFDGVQWNIVEDVPPSFPGICRGAPVLRRGIGNGPRCDVEIALEKGARTLIGGFGGDELLYETSILRDLFRHGRFSAIWRVTHRHGAGAFFMAEGLDAGLGLFSPRTARWIDNVRARRSPAPPRWMGPMRDLHGRSYEQFDLPRRSWLSHLQIGIWTRVTGPRTSALTDAMIASGIYDGIEVRLPFLDVRIVEYLLRVPWEHRVPRRRLRRLGREALGARLPRQVRDRSGQASWMPVLLATSRNLLPHIAPLIRSGPWLSAPFIDRGVARAMLNRSLTAGVTEFPDDSFLLCEFGALEAWLRSLFG